MDLSLSHTRASGFAQWVPPRGSFVSSGQADSESDPPRAGHRAGLNLRFYFGPRLVTGSSPSHSTRPSECLQGSTRPERVNRVQRRRLLKRRCGRVGRLTPTAPGIGAGCTPAYPSTASRRGWPGRGLRRGEVQARPRSLGRGLSPGQPTTVSVRVVRLSERCDTVCHALHGGVAGLGPSGGPPRDSD